ncbi:amino acid/polyamine transporter I [Vararia minispora EC-137]|uniref:Amino acid/polyamine transporter I n=1 Tax=Vararia minispora EC-137 TaxID=1314806 RepID=A0ACB8Q743_9AGAM|nr:amino acid/polyamine transporter I [Vararia minispora EC-137]
MIPSLDEARVRATETLDQDELLLRRLGYKQELRRTFTPLELFGVGFSIIGLFPSIASVLVYAIPNGGPSAMVWGWAVCVIGLLSISLSIAELGSAAPTSGGLYYWTHTFASPRYKNVLAWVVGYSNSVGNIASVASVAWGFSLQLTAAISIASNFSFVATTAQTYGIFIAALVVYGITCSVAVKYIARLQPLYIVLNVLLCLAIIIALPIATPNEFKNSGRYVFGHFENFSGWPDGFAFILSFLAPLWAVGAFDASVHISEEATNASVAVPWALMSATSIASVLGWGIVISIAFNMGTDLQAILNSEIGQPMAVILFNSFGRSGTLAVWIVVVIVQFIMGMDMLTVCSRQIFAFSRDGALPCSRILRRVDVRTRVPIRAVWFSVLVSALLGLLAFAGANAIGTIFSLVVAGQYVAYAIPISTRFLGKNNFKHGPFSLGRMSGPVATFAVLFMAFVLVVFFFPSSPGPMAANMNYTVVVLGGTLSLALSYFYFPKYGGTHWFHGPATTINADEETGGESQSASDKKIQTE